MNEINENISFKDYYEALEPEDKSRIRHLMIPAYMQYPTFYQKLRENRFTALELEKLSQLTGENFTR